MMRFLSKLLATLCEPAVRARRSIWVALVTTCLVLTVVGTSIPMLAQSQEKARDGANPQGQTVKRFHDRVAGYVKLQQTIEKSLTSGRNGDDAVKVEAHQKTFAQQMRQARQGADRGELFGDAAALFRTILATDQAARSPVERREVLKEMPTREQPKVNAEYPAGAPRATVPPLLLKRLPPLPEGLEYRLMDRDLILRDTRANIIADVLPDVLPGR